MKVNFPLILIMSALLFSSHAAENEEVKAKNACMVVVDRLAIQPALCEYNVRPATFWLCVNERIDDGESFVFASERCINITAHNSSGASNGFYNDES